MQPTLAKHPHLERDGKKIERWDIVEIRGPIASERIPGQNKSPGVGSLRARVAQIRPAEQDEPAMILVWPLDFDNTYHSGEMWFEVEKSQIRLLHKDALNI